MYRKSGVLGLIRMLVLVPFELSIVFQLSPHIWLQYTHVWLLQDLSGGPDGVVWSGEGVLWADFTPSVPITDHSGLPTHRRSTLPTHCGTVSTVSMLPPASFLPSARRSSSSPGVGSGHPPSFAPHTFSFQPPAPPPGLQTLLFMGPMWKTHNQILSPSALFSSVDWLNPSQSPTAGCCSSCYLFQELFSTSSQVVLRRHLHLIFPPWTPGPRRSYIAPPPKNKNKSHPSVSCCTITHI